MIRALLWPYLPEVARRWIVARSFRRLFAATTAATLAAESYAKAVDKLVEGDV